VTGRIRNAVLAGFLLSEQASARQSGIEVLIDRRSRLDELPPCITDLEAVTIVGNLLHNAVEAVGECADGDRRRVSVALLQEPGALVVRVRDRGPGASKETLSSMFACGVSTKRDHAGVGLALVRGIVRGAGGTIETRRAPGGGLVVTVRLPR
jgi:sensor histidine kinase regulating citrate/malate metabolism